MSAGFATVRRLNAAAREAGVADAVAQFENIATHSQYHLPYAITRRYVKPGDRTLDWGCGNGHFSFFLESIGARVTGYGYEAPPRVMSRSTTFQFVPGTEGETALLPFADRSFDVVLSVGVLEHVAELGGDERVSLSELARILTDGGVFLTFHLPNRSGWIERLVHVLRLRKHFHQRKYSATEIRALWDEAGFDVLDIGLYNALPRTELKWLPRPVRNGVLFAGLYDLLDDAIGWMTPSICTNFFVVARRRAAGE